MLILKHLIYILFTGWVSQIFLMTKMDVVQMDNKQHDLIAYHTVL